MSFIYCNTIVNDDTMANLGLQSEQVLKFAFRPEMVVMFQENEDNESHTDIFLAGDEIWYCIDVKFDDIKKLVDVQ